jgi:hypothetical protein
MRNEPSNSWEVSYVISIRKPHVDLDITKKELYNKLGRVRISQLNEWAHFYFSHQWFLDHIVRRPPPPKQLSEDYYF